MGFDPAPSAETATTCPYCGVGCGVLARPDASGERADVRGNPNHPANFGRLCSKGAALGETLSLEERLLYPEIRGRRSGWDEAAGLVAKTFQETIAQHGPGAVAFYVSGQLLTEDYYVANKLMKGFIGSANIDTNSRLCMASSVAGHKRAFGSDTVPGCYEDLELADLVILVGSNSAWCHPVLHQRLLAAKAARGTRLVVIDPRQTATTDGADLHLPIRPGTDVLLFNALFVHLAASRAHDQRFVARHTTGLSEALAAAGSLPLRDLAAATGIPQADIATFFRWVEETACTVTVYSQGVNQSSSGTDKVNAIINTHLVTGRIGRPGMGPFSVTGQPNAMGGREAGGLANQLAAHMDFAPADIDRVRRFWSAPRMAEAPGLKAVDLFEAVEQGRIQALWIMATNPAVSMPDAERVRRAIEKCPFVAVSDVSANADTVQLATVKLPATAWGEKSGTVTNSERRISRQRSFLSPPGEARHDWQIICDVARKMGFTGFDFETPAEIFREYAALSAFENEGSRDFDIGAHANLSAEGYAHLEPFQWPAKPDEERSKPGIQKRFFADGRFFTPDKRARFIATPFQLPADMPGPDYPFILNTGRVRDHWHTMTRTGKASRLSAHIAEPFLEVHPSDADRLGLEAAGLARVTSRHGESVLRVQITARVREGEVFAPMHWTARFTSEGRIDAAVSPATDPVSGQPELKFTPVRIAALKPDWYGFGVFSEEPDEAQLAGLAYWAKAIAPEGWRMEFAGWNASETAHQAATRLLPETEERSAASLTGAFSSRRGLFEGERLTGLVVTKEGRPVSADRTWLSGAIGKIHEGQALRLLAGRPPSGEAAGRAICACLGVTEMAINKAIELGAGSVEGVGDATGAGTNCGSCKPEIRKMLAAFSGSGPEAQKVAAE